MSIESEEEVADIASLVTKQYENIAMSATQDEYEDNGTGGSFLNPSVWHPLLAFELILAIKIYFPGLFGDFEHAPIIPAIHPTHLHKCHSEFHARGALCQ
jgi:hypothetical protein